MTVSVKERDKKKKQRRKEILKKRDERKNEGEVREIKD